MVAKQQKRQPKAAVKPRKQEERLQPKRKRYFSNRRQYQGKRKQSNTQQAAGLFRLSPILLLLSLLELLNHGCRSLATAASTTATTRTATTTSFVARNPKYRLVSPAVAASRLKRPSPSTSTTRSASFTSSLSSFRHASPRRNNLGSPVRQQSRVTLFGHSSSTSIGNDNKKSIPWSRREEGIISTAFSLRNQPPPPKKQLYFTAATTTTTATTNTALMMSNDNNSNDETETGTTTTPPPPLIDVDCNLWHSDLQSLLPQPSAGNNDDNENKEEEAKELLLYRKITTLLQEDAIRENNIIGMLSPSSTVQEAVLGLQVLKQYYDDDDNKSEPPPLQLSIRTTVGIHPYHVNDEEIVRDGKTVESNMQDIKHIITTERENNNNKYISAIGECGLDTTDGFPPLETQIPYFAQQVQLAKEFNLPLFIHERGAFRETMDILQTHIHDDSSAIPIIIHCFTGTQEECVEYIQRGYYISISGYIFKKKDDGEKYNEIQMCLQNNLIPLDRLMIETDAPYMGFSNCRKEYVSKNKDTITASLNSKKRKRLMGSTYPNVPSSLPQILNEVCHHINKGRTTLRKNEEPLTNEQLARHVTQNANEFFKLGC